MNQTKMPGLPEIFDHMDVIVGDIGASQLISAVHEYALAYAAQARVEEREACAKVCDARYAQTIATQTGPQNTLHNTMIRQVAELGISACAGAIRARSNP